MIHSLYSITLKLKTPSDEGKRMSFNNKEEDLLEAVKEFNAKYRSWSKRLLLTNIDNNFFDIILVLEKHKDKISTREIRSFTAFLNKDKNWSVYSREHSKLFEGVKFSKVSMIEAKEVISLINTDSRLYKSQAEDIDFILHCPNQLVLKEHNINEEKSKTLIESNEDLSDEQALAIFKYLLSTKNLGSKHTEKMETILQIKDILLKWI